jgi:hypothetical protein
MTLYRMLQRRGISSQWEQANTVLGIGEIGFSYDTNVIKVGDGQTPWNSLQSLDGRSAYELASINGFSGTEAEWLATLVGPQGEVGNGGLFVSATAPEDTNIVWLDTSVEGVVQEGPQGPQGPEGPAGPVGPAGPEGPAGQDSTIIVASTSLPTPSDGEDGNLWIVYS